MLSLHPRFDNPQRATFINIPPFQVIMVCIPVREIFCLKSTPDSRPDCVAFLHVSLATLFWTGETRASRGLQRQQTTSRVLG